MSAGKRGKSSRLLIATALCLLLALSLVSAASAKFPKYTNYVNDYTGLIKESDKAKLNALLAELDKKTTAQVAVALISTTAPLDLETYSVDLAQEWGMGRKGKDNGVLILIAKDDRKMRIEVGYGLEGKFTDGIAGRIIRDQFTPYFKEGKYGYGTVAGTTAVAQHVASIYGAKLTGLSGLPQARRPAEKGFGCGAMGLLPIFILLLFFRLGLFRFFLLASLLGSGRRGGFWSGGGHSSGGFGGGFGGFGGGSFGGGGASGSW